jgi:hypothetical protein
VERRQPHHHPGRVLRPASTEPEESPQRPRNWKTASATSAAHGATHRFGRRGPDAGGAAAFAFVAIHGRWRRYRSWGREPPGLGTAGFDRAVTSSATVDGRSSGRPRARRSTARTGISTMRRTVVPGEQATRFCDKSTKARPDHLGGTAGDRHGADRAGAPKRDSRQTEIGNGVRMCCTRGPSTRSPRTRGAAAAMTSNGVIGYIGVVGRRDLAARRGTGGRPPWTRHPGHPSKSDFSGFARRRRIYGGAHVATRAANVIFTPGRPGWAYRAATRRSANRAQGVGHRCGYRPMDTILDLPGVAARARRQKHILRRSSRARHQVYAAAAGQRKFEPGTWNWGLSRAPWTSRTAAAHRCLRGVSTPQGEDHLRRITVHCTPDKPEAVVPRIRRACHPPAERPRAG